MLNYCLQDTTCFTNTANVPCLIVKSVILILFKSKPKFCNFFPDQNIFLNKMPKTHELTLEQRQEIFTLKKRRIFQQRIFFQNS